MDIALGSDHRGIARRTWAEAAVAHSGHQPVDFGTHSEASCDYPDIAAAVCQAIVSGKCERGILICGTGIGMSIAANKFCGIRAAVCHDLKTAELSRLHNNANVLCLSDALDQQQLETIVAVWIRTEFEGGRHARRVEKIAELERQRGEC